jgi:hypothetical protein
MADLTHRHLKYICRRGSCVYVEMLVSTSFSGCGALKSKHLFLKNSRNIFHLNLA